MNSLLLILYHEPRSLSNITENTVGTDTNMEIALMLISEIYSKNNNRRMQTSHFYFFTFTRVLCQILTGIKHHILLSAVQKLRQQSCCGVYQRFPNPSLPMLSATEFVPNSYGVTTFVLDSLQLEELADEKQIFHIHPLSVNIFFPSNVEVRIIYKNQISQGTV